MTHSYHPHARKELDDATDFYDRIDPQLGDDFIKQIDECISRILRFPRSWPKLRGSIRRCLTHRFPYGVLYDIEDDHVFIVAIMHASRKPNYWAYRE